MTPSIGARLTIVLVAVLGYTVAGCGGGHHAARGASASAAKKAPGQAANGSSATSTTVRASKHTPTTATTATQRSSTATTLPAPTGVPITVTLASPCVRPGASQTITITTAPGSGVAYDSVYADGKSGVDKDHGFYGGNKGGQTDKQGTWTDTWVIAPTAPPGPVRVDVVAATPQGSGTTYATFAMADASGRCPS